MIGCGGTVRWEKRQGTCPVCHISGSWIVNSVSSSAYWGGASTCTNCGDCWADGEMVARPFLRGWRQKSIADAVRHWEESCGCPAKWDMDLGWALILCEHEVA